MFIIPLWAIPVLSVVLAWKLMLDPLLSNFDIQIGL